MIPIILPYWNFHCDLPSIGDSIRIYNSSTYTLDYIGMHKVAHMTINVQPKIDNNGLRDRGKAIGYGAKKLRGVTVNLMNKLAASNMSSSDMDDLNIELKHVIQEHFSLLEYLSHYLAEHSDTKLKERDIKFPIAHKKMTKSEYRGVLKDRFPKIELNQELIYDHLVEMQHFDGENWLLELRDLSNRCKHKLPPKMEMRKFTNKIVSYKNIGFRLGDIGFKHIVASEGSKIILRASDNTESTILGPFILNSDNVAFSLGTQSCLTITDEERYLPQICGTNKSVLKTLWQAHIEVLRAIHKISSLLSQPST